MPYRPYDCRDRMCGADDCRTCHPENFDEAGYPLPVCELCGCCVEAVNEDGICKMCLGDED